jgi:hypothetical protein
MKENQNVLKKAKSKITAGSPFEWIERMFDDYVRPATSACPFDYLVAVCGRVDSPGPRDARFEFIRDAGMPLLEKVLACEPIGPGPHFFIFPDRWLVPGEAVCFGTGLRHNPDAAKFGRVYVVTHQPYIVADCLKEQVRIVRRGQ